MSDVDSPRAIHLAAGQGTRLRPLTNDRPKPLVKLGGESLLKQNVDTLKAAGITDHIVVTGYEADQIDDLSFDTVHNDVYDETEMIYSLFCAANAFPEPNDGDLIISYGDIIYDQRVVEALLNCNSPICVVVDTEWRKLWEARFEDPLSDAETLNINENNHILEIGDKPSDYDDVDAQYIGLLKVRNDHIDDFIAAYNKLEKMQTNGFVSIDTTGFLQRLVDNGWRLQAVPVDGGWLEVDTLSDLRLYQGLHDNEELSKFL